MNLLAASADIGGTSVRHRASFLWLLLMVAAVANPRVGIAEKAKEPVYNYKLGMSKNKDLCVHMLDVFNTKFRRLWDVDILTSDDDPRYGPTSRYAFPTLPGVTHTSRMTFDLAYSRVPTSTEFDAVDWWEGRATLGRPLEDGTQSTETSGIPILVAQFDFDNDGQIDTVIKYGSGAGYRHMVYGKGASGLFAESIVVWRGRRWQPLPGAAFASIIGIANRANDRPIAATESYFRPFIFRGRTYVATYDVDLGPNGSAMERSPFRPANETMKVETYELAPERASSADVPAWKKTVICRFSMIQVSK